MSNFIKLERINSHGETNELIVAKDSIKAIKECHQTNQELYDENQVLIETRPNPKQYIVFVDGVGELFYINETSYQTLSKELLK